MPGFRGSCSRIVIRGNSAFGHAPRRAAREDARGAGVRGPGLRQRLAVGGADARLGAGQERRAHLHRLGAQGQSPCNAAPVHDAARRDDGRHHRLRRRHHSRCAGR